MNRSLYVVGAGVLAVGLLAAASPARAAARPAVASHAVASHAVASHVGAVTADEQQRVADYWTPERMRAATPMDLITVDSGVELSPVPRGRAATVDATVASFPNVGSVWTGGGTVVRTTGRVFFTNPDGGGGGCSGSAVTSANKSVVITAGHCVKHGVWRANFVFVPGYDDGRSPLGKWTASKLMAVPQWADAENLQFDIGAAVMNPLAGKRLTDVVGGQGIAFNQARGIDMYAFGYPAGRPYDGRKLIYCSGTTLTNQGFGDNGLTCNMTPGASGGPWLLGFSEATGTGTVNSVTSVKVITRKDRLLGPYFGVEAQDLYNAAQAVR
jgi:V8-like Glu-specific endopeptidase